MRTIKLFGAILFAVCCLGLSSCKKQVRPLKIDFTINVTDVKAINAKLEITASGDAASLIRYLSPTPEADVLAAVGSFDNASEMQAFISRNGSAIKLPYKVVLMDLLPEQKYVVGVVAYDANMNVFGYSTKVFTTLDLASLTENPLGDLSDVGNMTENIL